MAAATSSVHPVTFGTVNVDGLNIAYREAGDPAGPKLVLLHGFPSSSHQYRDLIAALADRFHVVAPDYQDPVERRDARLEADVEDAGRRSVRSQGHGTPALGEFAVWRAARAVGDHDLNSFLMRADPTGPTPKLEPGMTVWIDETGKRLVHDCGRGEAHRSRLLATVVRRALLVRVARPELAGHAAASDGLSLSEPRVEGDSRQNFVVELFSIRALSAGAHGIL